MVLELYLPHRFRIAHDKDYSSNPLTSHLCGTSYCKTHVDQPPKVPFHLQSANFWFLSMLFMIFGTSFANESGQTPFAPELETDLSGVLFEP